MTTTILPLIIENTKNLLFIDLILSALLTILSMLTLIFTFEKRKKIKNKYICSGLIFLLIFMMNYLLTNVIRLNTIYQSVLFNVKNLSIKLPNNYNIFYVSGTRYIHIISFVILIMVYIYIHDLDKDKKHEHSIK